MRIMKGLTSKSRQNFFTIITIVGLLVVFSFYFFVYIPQQERKLEKENFRVLTRITNNISGRVSEYRQYINDRARIAAMLSSYFRERKSPETFSIFENNFTQITNFYLRDIPELELIYFSPVNKNPDQSLVRDKLANLTKPYFLFIRDTCSYEGERYEYGFTLNADCFHYLLTDKTFESCFLRRGEIIIAGPNAGVLAGTEDSLLLATNGLKTGRFFSQEISGSTKKVFAQPFRLGTEEHFVLCGYIDKDEYYSKTRNLSGTVILIILLLLFLLALSLPFVKFLLMSRNERLSIADTLMAGITVILGTAVLVLVLLDVYTYYVPVKESREQQMAALSVEISDNFRDEITAICNQLAVYDELIGKKSSKILMDNFISISDTAKISEKEESSFDENSKVMPAAKLREADMNAVRPTVYKNFNQVFWTDSAGMQLFKWSTGPTLTPMINVNNRPYFTNIIGNKGWSIPGKNTRDFYMEGIYSRTTGENMVAISKRSNRIVSGDNVQSKEPGQTTFHTGIVAMITNLNSVMDPILPIGNGFCIIDESGKVIFHSDRSKNLSENFLDECSARDKIKSAMYSRTPGYFSTAYQGEEYKMYIRPVNNLPFYLITFQDTVYPITSNTEVLSLSVLFVVFFFLFICMQVIVLRLITSKETQLKAKVFGFDWLWPLKEKQRAYQHILVFLVPAFVLLLIFLHSAGPVETLLIFFASSVFVFAFIYLKIDQFNDNTHRKSMKAFLSSNNVQIIAASLTILVILNIISTYLIDHVMHFCLYQVMLCALAIALFAFNIPVLKIFSFRRCYLVIQLGIITLVSIVPTFAFFRVSFEKEAEISIRHMQLELATELNRKSDELNKSYKLDNPDEEGIYSASFYKTRFWKSDFPGLKKEARSISPEEDVFSQISISLTPSYNDIVTQENNLTRQALDSTWRWEKYGKKFMLFHFNDLQRSPSNVDSLMIMSEVPAYNLPLPFGVHGFGVRGTLFWIGILLCMIALYCFIRFFVRIIFTTDFFRNNQYNKLGIVSLNGYFDTTNVFLVGAPYSGKTDWLKKQVSNDKVRYEINLNSLKKLEDVKMHLEKCKTADIIVIDQFEYGFRDYAVAKRRLRLFEELKRLENKRILVVSNIHPRLFLEEYPEAPVEQAEGEEKKASVEIEFDDCERWKKILEGYHKIYFPACGVVEKEPIPHADLIDRECSNSYFLRSRKEVIRESLKNENPDHPLTDEEIILRIESMAHVYYNSIWSSLSEEEQYILYDIAQDGLVNLKNREVLTMLLHKGLLVYENRFKMMSESFRNFVLSEVSADDALELEQKVKETGSWNYFKTPVIIILITIAMFIAITQEETFNSIIAFITTFAAGIPIILRLLGMVTSMKMGKNKAA
jgi:hypothetical protein